MEGLILSTLGLQPTRLTGPGCPEHALEVFCHKRPFLLSGHMHWTLHVVLAVSLHWMGFSQSRPNTLTALGLQERDGRLVSALQAMFGLTFLTPNLTVMNDIHSLMSVPS